MPRLALQPDDIAAFRARAAAAATRLFAARGYDGVTMRALADELGVSAMTSYRYLAGKDELFALVRAEAFRRFGARLERAVARVVDPGARLRRLKQAYIAFAVDEADAYRIMFELRSPPAAAAGDAGPAAAAWPEVEEASRRAFAVLHDAVRAAIAAGLLAGDPLTVAHLLWASTHGLVSLHLAGRLTLRSLAELAAVDHELGQLAPRATGSPRSRSRRRPRPTATRPRPRSSR